MNTLKDYYNYIKKECGLKWNLEWKPVYGNLTKTSLFKFFSQEILHKAHENNKIIEVLYDFYYPTEDERTFEEKCGFLEAILDIDRMRSFESLLKGQRKKPDRKSLELLADIFDIKYKTLDEYRSLKPKITVVNDNTEDDDNEESLAVISIKPRHRNYMYIGGAVILIVILGVFLIKLFKQTETETPLVLSDAFSIQIADFTLDNADDFSTRLVNLIRENKNSEDVRVNGLRKYIDNRPASFIDTLYMIKDTYRMERGMIVFGNRNDKTKLFDCNIFMVGSASNDSVKHPDKFIYIKNPDEINFSIDYQTQMVASFIICMTRYYLGEYDKAISCFEISGLEDSKYDKLVSLSNLFKGNSYMHVGEPEKAAELYEAAIERSPSFPELYYNSAIAYEATNDTLKAIEFYKKADSLGIKYDKKKIDKRLKITERDSIEAVKKKKAEKEKIRKKLKPKFFIDKRDGSKYKIVKIGKQTWLAEDFRFGSGNNYTNVHYTWLDAKKVCPDGWRLPNRKDWDELIEYYGGKNKAGRYLKKGGKSSFNADLIFLNDNDYVYEASFFKETGPEKHFWCATDFSATDARYYIFYKKSNDVKMFWDSKDSVKYVRYILNE